MLIERFNGLAYAPHCFKVLLSRLSINHIISHVEVPFQSLQRRRREKTRQPCVRVFVYGRLVEMGFRICVVVLRGIVSEMVQGGG